ncbi:MAG: acyl-CoA dehydrogenase family protein [Gemmatimonadota bacterium]|nr:acyl-CoA dehydrogenase family protein [Gemmatimonadota bacterium]MDH3421986.1 acyl-CoA dehydrogenase family protein [Gemmatimonadota bacterium]
MTSKRTLASELEAREVAEQAREESWEQRSFARSLFEGAPHFDLMHPYPQPDPEEQARGAEFLKRLEAFAGAHIDGDAIDREGWVPQDVLDGLAELGAFGIKTPIEYGGLGLSQLSYVRALSIVGSRCGSTGAFLSAHQSIGVPGPLLKFGTDEQKARYLPRLAKGALSAFALTENDVGSDPANMSTTAELSEDGSHWILNGEKLWTTNGPRAEIIVVMASTPAREGSSRRPITAFIVETAWEGVEVAHLCSFMGLRGLSNGILRFTDVRVPSENLLWGEGKGLKLALVTLNTGRLALPAFCAAAGKGCLDMLRDWASHRVQWGRAIGKHDAVAQMLGGMTADTFAMDAIAELTASMSDSGRFDIRLEAAIAKLWATEVAWDLVSDAVQVRGGRGYETHDSLASRGETPYPIERYLRDMRINKIFEGSSEIMRLFIAREAVDMHLRVAGDLLNPKAPTGKRLKALVRAGLHYAWWYPTRFLGWGLWPRHRTFGPLAGQIRYIERASRRLARATFHAMVRFGPALEKQQAVLGRLVDIGAELFVMTAVVLRARMLAERGAKEGGAQALAELHCRRARRRIAERFSSLFRNDDRATYSVAKRFLEGEFAWVEQGIVPLDAYRVSPQAATKDRGGVPDPVEEPVTA